MERVIKLPTALIANCTDYNLLNETINYSITFGKPPKLLWAEDTGGQNGIVVDNPVVRIVRIAYNTLEETDRLELLLYKQPSSYYLYF